MSCLPQPTWAHPYALVTTADAIVKEAVFDRLSDLATAIYRHYSNNKVSCEIVQDSCALQVVMLDHVRIEAGRFGFVYRQVRRTTQFEALGHGGARLKIVPLLDMGRAIHRDQIESRRSLYTGYCGYGPVPGTRKSRGGIGYSRRMKTVGERRLNALVLHDDGEVACRSSRFGGNLPSSWDDKFRNTERNWKSQHKGIKSWDRT